VESLLPWDLVQAHPLAAIALVFILDGLGIPLLPEVAVLLAYAMNPGLAWGALLLGLIVVLEVLANFLLYAIMRWIGMPRLLARLLRGYSKSLLLADERLILLNRVIPVLPMGGAFIHLRGWPVGRSFAYVALGSFAKYGLLLLAWGTAYAYFQSGTALWVGLGLAGVFLAASWAVALRRWVASRRPTPEPA
jgi:hypothetical protein